MSKRQQFKARIGRQAGACAASRVRNGLRRRRREVAVLAICTLASPSALADSAVSCGGYALLGGAQLNCSHVLPTAPTQFCTYSWTLMTTGGVPDTVQGSFLLPPGSSNATIYQGSGFNSVLSNPVVLCQGRKSR